MEVEGLTREGNGWAEALSKDYLGWEALKDHLRENHGGIFKHFAELERLDDGIPDLRRAKRLGGFAFAHWVSGGDINDIDALLETVDTLLGSCDLPNDLRNQASKMEFKRKIFEGIRMNSEWYTKTTSSKEIWSLSLDARRALVASWIQEMDIWKVCESFAEIHRRHQVAFARKIKAHEQMDARLMCGKEVIGMTTTACARNWDLINSVKPRVVIVEEASEVMLPHALCHLFSSIQHMISIGDHLQLRPQINTMALSMEHPGGERYRLDESLFERLIYAHPPVPTSQLNVQRRMHPDIADLSRAGDYCYLIDHESTVLHPPIAGMVNRMYWLDHKEHEDRADPRSSMANSQRNRFEVEFAAALVRYLIEVNGYNLGDIVILTPYNGQLAALTSKLAATCSVFLTEKDRDALIDQGLLLESNLVASGGKNSVKLSDMLRLSSVDNYQGEECKIVIFSAVRSNPQRAAGFVKSRNRINVACSRARDGFYVLGNATTLMAVKHWASIIEAFKAKKAIGPSFKVCCSQHPQGTAEVSEPAHFRRIPACEAVCGKKLPCGHACELVCVYDFLGEQGSC
jgi:hypothetical protein